MTSLLDGQATKVRFASTSVTSRRGARRFSMRAQVAPAKPPPMTTARPAVCARACAANKDAGRPTAAPDSTARRVNDVGAPSVLRRSPASPVPSYPDVAICIVTKPLGRTPGCMAYADDHDLVATDPIEDQIRVRHRHDAAQTRLIGLASGMGMMQQEAATGLDALLNTTSAARMMLRDIGEHVL